MTSSTLDTRDRQIQDDVRAELVWRPEVADAEVGVSVIDGVVTLSGEVSTYAQRLAAREAALSVLGVSVIANDLVVRHAVSSEQTDTDIATAVKQVLGWSHLPQDRVHAEVRNHVVHLTGTLDWDYQRLAAERSVHDLVGVRHVDNQIVLSPRLSAPDTADRIKAAMARHAAIDADAITVTTSETEVTLTGEVHSWDERNAAVHAAWGSPHVTAVNDEILVTE